MKNFLKILVIGVFLLALSGVVAAEEWKTYNLPELVPIKVSVPSSFEDKGRDEKDGNNFISAFMNEGRGILVMIFKEGSILEASKDFQTDYGMDELTTSEESDFIKRFSKKGETGKFITLQNGHKALLVDVNRSGAYGKMIVIVKKGYLIGIMVLKEGQLNANEQKFADEVFQKAVF